MYIHISCKCDTNRAGHFTLDAHASRPVACLSNCIITEPLATCWHIEAATKWPQFYRRHFKCIFLNENVALRFRFSLFLRVKLAIFHHWFRQWLGTYQVTSHHLTQPCLVYWRLYVSLGLCKWSESSFCQYWEQNKSQISNFGWRF